MNPKTSERLRSLSTVLAYAGTFSIGAIASYIAYHPSAELCGLFSSSLAASWAQALGSLGAVFGLALATFYQQKKVEASTELQSLQIARKLAYLIWPSYLRWGKAAKYAAAPADFDNVNSRMLREFLHTRAPAAFTPPPDIATYLNEFQHLGDAGASILDALAEAAVGADLLKRLRRPEPDSFEYEIFDYDQLDVANDILKIARSVDKNLEKASNEIILLITQPRNSMRSRLADYYAKLYGQD